MNGQYQPIVIEDLPGGVLQGYSAALNLNLRWEDGQLVWHDPATRQRIVTLDDERIRADSERQARLSEQARADNEQQQTDPGRRHASNNWRRSWTGCAAADGNAIPVLVRQQTNQLTRLLAVSCIFP